LESLGGDEEGNATAALAGGAATLGLGRLGAGADGCAGAAAKQPNISSSMVSVRIEARRQANEHKKGCHC
jgi:hypothetical protein